MLSSNFVIFHVKITKQLQLSYYKFLIQQGIHRNDKEDRQYEFRCGRNTGRYTTHDCFWTAYLNCWDEVVNFICPHNYVVGGVHSIHNNGKEDRRSV